MRRNDDHHKDKRTAAKGDDRVAEDSRGLERYAPNIQGWT